MLTPVEYLQVLAVPYIWPVHPGSLVIPVGPPVVPQYLRLEMRADHNEDVRVFREADNVAKALKKQLSEAIPELYLKRFRDRNTNTLIDTLQVILQYLFSTYGEITAEELGQTENKLKKNI